MNKLFIIFVAGLLFLNINSVLAQQEYTTDWTWADAGLCRDNLALHAPRVACNPNNPDDCAVLQYFSGDFWGGSNLQLRWSFNGLDTLNAPQNLPETVNYNTGIHNLTDNYALPYDIYHNGSDYIIAFDTGDTFSESYIYSWSPTLGFNMVWNATNHEYAIIEIIDNIEKIYVLSFPFGTNKINATLLYLNGTIYKHLGYVVDPTLHFCAAPPCVDFLDARGFVAMDDTETNIMYKIFIRYGNGIPPASPSFYDYTTITNLGTFPATYDAIWYWDKARIFYKNTTQINYVPTTNLITFGDIVFYYTFNDSVQQYINYTDYDEVSATTSYAYKSYTNQTIGTEWCPLPQTRYLYGSFASQRDLKRLNIYSSSLDLNDGSTDAINITAILDCDDFTYTTSGSGDFISLTTPCENNTLSLIAPSGFEPFSSTVNDIQLTDDCPTTSIVVDDYLSDYDLEVRTRDLVFYTPIDGVLVNVDGTTNTTNAQGITTIPNFFPVSGSDFIRGTKTSCAYDFTFDGTPDVISVAGTKTGYSTFTTTDTFAESPFDFGSFTRDYLIEMTPPSTEIEVKAYTLDNVEIESSSSQILVSIYGANNTFLFDEGNYFEQNTASELPSQFLLVDNRSSWSVNVTLDFYGQHYQQNVTVTEGGFKTVKFTVNFTSNVLPCETNLDCPTSFCDGNFYKKARGCIANICEYDTDICKSAALCDDDRGCFDAQGTESCEDDTDCTNQSYCLTTKKSRTGLCGSNNLCIFKDVICAGECNATTGLCYESDLCLLLGQIKHRFLIQTTTQPFIEGVYTTYVDADYYCGLDNRGERECISGAVVPTTPDLVGVTTLPDTWEGITNTDGNYVYYDVSLICDTLCNITYEYCEYGCNAETGFCHHAPTEAAGQIKGWMDAIAQMWWTFFPNIAASTLGWILLSLGLSVALGALVGKEAAGQIFLGSMMAMVGAGAVVGVVINWFSLAFIIVSGFVLWKFYRGV